MEFEKSLIASVAAEFLCNFLLMCNGCMAAIFNVHVMGTVIADNVNYGLIVMALTQIFGCVSGAHINPCVTIAAVIMKELPLEISYLYLAAQFLGSILGFGFLMALTPTFLRQAYICVTVPSKSIGDLTAVMIEYLLTAGWMMAVCSNWQHKNRNANDWGALRIGISVACLVICGDSFTDASMNPARSFAPALWQNHYLKMWVYFVGPILAAVTIPYAWRIIFINAESRDSTD